MIIRRIGLLVVSLCAASLLAVSTPADAATVLTVSGNTTLAPQPMETELRGVMCRLPNVCKKVVYNSGGIGQDVYTSGYKALKTALAQTPGKKVIMAYSQGAVVATDWLTKDAKSSTAPSPVDMYLVILGNQSQALNGRQVKAGGAATPNNTAYTVIDICRQYDGVCDYPDIPSFYAVLNANRGYSEVHGDYTDVDVNDPDNWVRTVGNTTYVLIPTEHLPMFSYLRRLGMNGLADQLDAQWKPIIDSAYNRSGYVRLGDRVILPVPGYDETTSLAASSGTAELGASVATLNKSAEAQALTAAMEDKPAPLIVSAPQVDSATPGAVGVHATGGVAADGESVATDAETPAPELPTTQTPTSSSTQGDSKQTPPVQENVSSTVPAAGDSTATVGSAPDSASAPSISDTAETQPAADASGPASGPTTSASTKGSAGSSASDSTKD